MCLSEEILYESCANPQARNQKSTEQTSMRTKWLKHIAIQTVEEHLLIYPPAQTNTCVGNRPNTVSGSAVSDTELSEFFGAH